MKSRRLNFFLFLFFLAATAIVARLFYVQILSHKFYQSQALGQQAGFKEITGVRGQVFFENSNESHGAAGVGEIKSLAINKDAWLVSVMPKKLQNKTMAAS